MLFNAWYIVFPTILFSYKLKVCWWKMVLWNFASRNFCTFSFYNQLLFFRALIWLTGRFITAISDMLRQRLWDIKTEIRCEVFCIYLTIAMSVYCWCPEPDNTFKTCLVVSYSCHSCHSCSVYMFWGLIHRWARGYLILPVTGDILSETPAWPYLAG